MKKRIALAAAVALAISVGGMLPASATKLGAPTLTSSSCAQAGGTVEVKAFDGDVTVSRSGLNLVVAVANEDNGSADCTTAAASVTNVLIKATDEAAGGLVTDALGTGKVTIVLTVDASTIASFAGVTMSIQSEDVLKFDGSALTSTLKYFSGTIAEETFAVSSATGAYYAGGGVTFVGGDGPDALDASGVTTTDLTLNGDAGNDTLKGGEGDDSITGGEGNDVLYGNAGDDTLNSSDTVAPTCTRPHKIFPDTKCLDDLGSPVSGADEAWGGVGDDTITADAPDTVAPGDGMDSVTGPIAQLAYVDSSAAIKVDLATAGVVRSTAGDDYITGSVYEYVGSKFEDTFLGNSSANAFYGYHGADVINGYGGDDFLSGNGGKDKIKGGLGDDTIYGDTGADLINGGGGNDTIAMGGGDDIAYGSEGDDILRGNKGSDQAWGGRGTFDVCAAEVTDSCEFTK